MWSETLSYYKTGLRPAEYGFGRHIGLAGFVLVQRGSQKCKTADFRKTRTSLEESLLQSFFV